MKSKITESKLIDLFLDIGLLKKVQRTGWVLKGIKNVESVAEHSWRVALLALMLAPQLDLDQLKLVKMALIHDLGESLIGDIKWESGIKVIGSRSDKHKDEQKAVKEMFTNNKAFSEYLNLWHEFEKQKTPEAKIMKQLDKLEMIIQAYEYQQEGYKYSDFNEFWENAEKYLKGKDLEYLYNYLSRKREDI